MAAESFSNAKNLVLSILPAFLDLNVTYSESQLQVQCTSSAISLYTTQVRRIITVNQNREERFATDFHGKLNDACSERNIHLFYSRSRKAT